MLIAVLEFPDVLVSTGVCKGTLAMGNPLLELPDVCGSIGVCIGAVTVMENA